MEIVTTGPSEALIVSGLGYGDSPKIVVAGRAIIFPRIHTVCTLPLGILTLIIDSHCVYTSQGVPVSVTGVAQVRKQQLAIRAMWQLDESSTEIHRIQSRSL